MNINYSRCFLKMSLLLIVSLNTITSYSMSSAKSEELEVTSKLELENNKKYVNCQEACLELYILAMETSYNPTKYSECLENCEQSFQKIQKLIKQD